MLSTRDDIINSILCSTRNIPNTYFKLSGDVSTIIERLLQACSRDSQFSEILGRFLMEKRLGLIFFSLDYLEQGKSRRSFDLPSPNNSLD